MTTNNEFLNSEASELLQIPAVAQDWVTSSLLCGNYLPTAGFSPSLEQLMPGVRVCVSDVGRNDATIEPQRWENAQQLHNLVIGQMVELTSCGDHIDPNETAIGTNQSKLNSQQNGVKNPPSWIPYSVLNIKEESISVFKQENLTEPFHAHNKDEAVKIEYSPISKKKISPNDKNVDKIEKKTSIINVATVSKITPSSNIQETTEDIVVLPSDGVETGQSPLNKVASERLSKNQHPNQIIRPSRIKQEKKLKINEKWELTVNKSATPTIRRSKRKVFINPTFSEDDLKTRQSLRSNDRVVKPKLYMKNKTPYLKADCGLCKQCLNMIKFGGSGSLRKACINRKSGLNQTQLVKKKQPKNPKLAIKYRIPRCGTCPACLKPDCGLCKTCLNMIKFGGSGSMRQACLKRICIVKT